MKKETAPKILYKKGNKITLRKPKKLQDYISFKVPSKESLNSVKNFLKYIITDIRELNLAKNDLCFLINQIFDRIGKDHSTDTSVPAEHGVIFYVWVYLPYKYNLTLFSTPDLIREDIFAFDLFYVRQKMTNTDIKQIQDILEQQVDIHVHTRRPGEVSVVPFSGLKVTTSI